MHFSQQPPTDRRADPEQTGIFKKGDSSTETNPHVSRPLSELQDPSAFGPPPKHIRTGVGAGAGAGADIPPQSRPAPARPTRNPSQAPGDEAYQPTAYRMDTTGLSTSQLPPPPTHASLPIKPWSPALPPRLPPRSASPSPFGPPPLPARQGSADSLQAGRGYVNQAAVSRLAAAGIFVPDLGIVPPARTDGTDTDRNSNSSQMGGLQSRFATMRTTSQTSPPPPSEGTTWAQKQTALQTITDFHRSPGSISVADAKSTASTINNFRQRHGDQVSAGLQKANSFSQKYGVGDGIGNRASGESVPNGGSPVSAVPTVAAATSLLGKKKPPPPPPKKNTALSNTMQGEPPPPIPTSTKPRF